MVFAFQYLLSLVKMITNQLVLRYIYLCAVFSFCLADHSHVECSEHDKTDYVHDHLSLECATGLEHLHIHVPPSPNEVTATRFTYIMPSADDLDTVCQESCNGAYSKWLRNTCGDVFTARGIEVMCAFTAGTTNLGPRCRSAFPDAYNERSVFQKVFTLCNFDSSTSCIDRVDGTVKCATSDVCLAFSTVTDSFGCCYQSLFNDTEFAGYLTREGLIDETTAETLRNFGLSPLWKQCGIEVPPKCEQLASAAASSAASIVRSTLTKCFVFASIMSSFFWKI